MPQMPEPQPRRGHANNERAGNEAQTNSKAIAGKSPKAQAWADLALG